MTYLTDTQVRVCYDDVQQFLAARIEPHEIVAAAMLQAMLDEKQYEDALVIMVALMVRFARVNELLDRTCRHQSLTDVLRGAANALDSMDMEDEEPPEGEGDENEGPETILAEEARTPVHRLQ